MAFSLPVFSDAPPIPPNNNAINQPAPLARHPKSAPGPFYVVDGECMYCGMAPAEALELLVEPTDSDNSQCYFKRQPETPDEIIMAIRAIAVSEAEAIRYGGDDPNILQLLSDYDLGRFCDHPIPPPRPNPVPLWPRAFAPHAATVPKRATPARMISPILPFLAGYVHTRETYLYTVTPEGRTKQTIRKA